MRKTTSGFTIVELLIVIVVIAILAAIAIVSYNGIQTRAGTTAVMSDLKQAASQLEMDVVLTGSYPSREEDADDGRGLRSSPRNTLYYSYDAATNSYCVTGISSLGGVQPHSVSSSSRTPQQGPCPEHIDLVDDGEWEQPGELVMRQGIGGVVAYGNGRFVSITGGEAKVSTDGGLNWTTHSVPEVSWDGWRSAAYGNGRFVALGERGFMITSTDGQNWTIPSVPGRDWQSVTYGNGRFVAIGYDEDHLHTVMTSTDGQNWTSHPVPEGAYFSWLVPVSYGNGRFVALGEEGSMMTSTDGQNWTSHSAPGGGWNYWKSVTYGNGRFVAVGHSVVMISTDGQNWTSYSAPVGNWWSVTYGNGHFVSASDDGRVMTSNNGRNWSLYEEDVFEPGAYARSVYGDGVFLIGGEGW